MNTGLGSSNVQALAIDPDTPERVYAGAGDSGIYQSADGGEEWSSINNALSNKNVLTLAIEPVSTKVLYAGTVGEGLFKLTDIGRGIRKAGSGSGGGGCFILTSGCGVPTEHYMKALKDLRGLLAN